jgi:hypothetical protein
LLPSLDHRSGEPKAVMWVSLWLILLDVLRQQDGGISAIPPGPQQIPMRTQLKPVAKDGDVFATIVDVAGIVAHNAGQVRLHEQISSSIRFPQIFAPQIASICW